MEIELLNKRWDDIRHAEKSKHQIMTLEEEKSSRQSYINGTRWIAKHIHTYGNGGILNKRWICDAEPRCAGKV